MLRDILGYIGWCGLKIFYEIKENFITAEFWPGWPCNNCRSKNWIKIVKSIFKWKIPLILALLIFGLIAQILASAAFPKFPLTFSPLIAIAVVLLPLVASLPFLNSPLNLRCIAWRALEQGGTLGGGSLPPALSILGCKAPLLPLSFPSPLVTRGQIFKKAVKSTAYLFPDSFISYRFDIILI